MAVEVAAAAAMVGAAKEGGASGPPLHIRSKHQKGSRLSTGTCCMPERWLRAVGRRTKRRS